MALEINDIEIASTATKQGKLIIKRHLDTVDPTVNDDSSAGYDMGDRWMNSSTQNEFVCCSAAVGAASWKKTTELTAVASDMPGLQMKRTTDDTLTTTEANITYNLTPFENNTAVLEHDNTNTDRMHIKETGAYLLGINITCENTTNIGRTLTIRLRVDDTTTAATLIFEITKSATEVFARTIPVSLTAGTYITIDAKGSSNNDLILRADSTFWAIRMSGKTGATGAAGIAGADGDMTWQGNWVSQNYTANQAVKYTNGNSYVCKLDTVSSEVPTNATYWDVLAEKGDAGSGGGDLSIAIQSHNGAYVSESSTTYLSKSEMIFNGTTASGTPSKIKCATWMDGGGTSYSCRVYDLTNAQVICEVTGQTNTSRSVIDMGTLSNLPASAAVFSIDLKVTGTTTSNISALFMEF